MKKTIILLSLMLISITSFTQTEIPVPDEFLTKRIIAERIKILKEAPFVFEGTVIKSEGFFNGKGVYTSNIVQINKIFRGDGLKLGTIEVITEGGTAKIPNDGTGIVERFTVSTGHGGDPNFYGRGSGLFFCMLADSNLSIQPLTTDNTVRTKYWDCIFYPVEGFYGGITGMNLSFKSYNELYTYLKKTGYLTVQLEEKLPVKKTEEPPMQLTPAQKKAEADSIKQANKILYEQSQKNYQHHMEERMKIIDAQQKKGNK